MEYRVSGFLVVILVLVAALPVSAAPPRAELDDLVDKWIAALNQEDLEDFLDCYWDDAVRISYFPAGESKAVSGIEALRVEQAAGNEAFDFLSMNLVYDEPVRFFPEDSNPVYVCPNSWSQYMDVFEFEKRRGRYRIVRQYLMPHPPADQ